MREMGMPQPTPPDARGRAGARRSFHHGDVIVDIDGVRHVVLAIHVDERETILVTIRLDTGEDATLLASKVAYRVSKP